MDANRNRPNSAVTIQSAISSHAFSNPSVKVQKHFPHTSLNQKHKITDVSLPTHIPYEIKKKQDDIKQPNTKKKMLENPTKRKIIPVSNVKQTINKKDRKFGKGKAEEELKGLTSKELQLHLESIGSQISAFEKSVIPVPKIQKQIKNKREIKHSDAKLPKKLPRSDLDLPAYCPEDYMEDIVKQKEQVVDKMSKLLQMSDVPNSLTYQLVNRRSAENVSDTRVLLKKIKDELATWRLEHSEDEHPQSCRGGMMSTVPGEDVPARSTEEDFAEKQRVEERPKVTDDERTKDAVVQTSAFLTPPRQVTPTADVGPLYPLDDYLPNKSSPEQSTTTSPDQSDFVSNTLHVINIARRQIQRLQRETFKLPVVDSPGKTREPSKKDNDKIMWSPAGYKQKATVSEEFISFADLQQQIIRINQGSRREIKESEFSVSKERPKCPPNSPSVDEIHSQHLENVAYVLKNSSRPGNENEQNQIRMAKSSKEKLAMKDINVSSQNVCNCKQSKEEMLTRKMREENTIKHNTQMERLQETKKMTEENYLEHNAREGTSTKSLSRVSITKSDAETNTEFGIPFRNTPNTAIITVKTQETSTRFINNVESKECSLKKTLQIQTMPSIRIQPKFTIQKGSKVHIPPSSMTSAANMKRKNVELKQFFYPSVNIVHNVMSDEVEQNVNQMVGTDCINQNIPEEIEVKEISVHDKLNSLAKSLSLKLDNDKKKSKSCKKLSQTLKMLSGNISKLFDSYLETVPQSLKRLSPRMKVIASLLLEELHSPTALTEEYCVKLIDSMHYLIQDLEKEYETRICQKNLLQPPQQVSTVNDGTTKTELRRPHQDFTVCSKTSNLQTSTKEQLKGSVKSKVETKVSENQSQNPAFGSHGKFVKNSVQKKPIFKVGQPETTSNVKHLLHNPNNTGKPSTTECNNRNPLLQSNYLKSELVKNQTLILDKSKETSLHLAGTGAIPKTKQPNRSSKLKQWQNERMKSIQDIHKKLLMTELTLTRPDKSYREEIKARESEMDTLSEGSSSAIEFVKKYIQINNHGQEKPFRNVTTPATENDNEDITEDFSAVENEDIEIVASKASEKESDTEDEISASDQVDDADNDVYPEYAEDWEEDEDESNSSHATAGEWIKKSKLQTVVDEENAVPSLGGVEIKPVASDLKNNKPSQCDTELIKVQMSENNTRPVEVNTGEISSNNTSVKTLTSVVETKNLPKGCSTSVKKSFCDRIDQVPLEPGLFGFDSNTSLIQKPDIRVGSTNNAEQISDLSVPNLNLDTSPIESLIQVSMPKTNTGNSVKVNTSKSNQNVNIVVHVVNDSDPNKQNDKQESGVKPNLERNLDGDKSNQNNPSTSIDLEKPDDKNVNIDELISSNLKKYVIQPTVNEMFEKFKTNTVLDSESIKKTGSKPASPNVDCESKQSETTLNLIKPNLILQSSGEFWHSVKGSTISQDKNTQSDKMTQDFSVQTDCEKFPVQTQVTESLASDNNKKQSDKTDSNKFSNITIRYISSSQTRSSESDTQPSSSSSSSAVPYQLKSLKWSLSSLFNSDEPLSEGEIVLSTSSSEAHSLGEVKSYLSVPKIKHSNTSSLGEIKRKPPQKSSRRGTGTSTPEISYSVSKEKSLPQYITPRPSVQAEEKTFPDNCSIDDAKPETKVSVEKVASPRPNCNNRISEGKIVSKTFNELATDILQELINEGTMSDDSTASNKMIVNVGHSNENLNYKKLTKEGIENVPIKTYTERFEKYTTKSRNPKITNEQIKTQVTEKSKLGLDLVNSNFNKQKPIGLITCQSFTPVRRSYTSTDNRLVMNLENQTPNLEVFIEESHSEISSVSLSGTSILTISSDELPGVCEFDLTLGSRSSGEVSAVRHSELICSSSTDS